MESKDKTVYVVNHTHWDREWYETFEQFRFKLKDAIDYIVNLIDEKKVKYFLLDGQTIVLEDYKEIVSNEKYEKLISLIKEKKIEVGPWYVLPDEFLVSGESIVRNLQIGIGISKSVDSKYGIGYLPDTFGHISQLPQIFKKMGMQHALIARGAVANKSEIMWQGADETEIFTFVLPLFEGYYQPFLSQDEYAKNFDKYINGIKPYATSDNLLVLHGADHLTPANDLDERIENLNKQFPELDIKEVLMSEFIKAFEENGTYEKLYGEQRNPQKSYVLPGVLSARTYLKQSNQKCEDILTGIVEPLDLMTEGTMESDEYITYLWKLLLQNHPHDSICGCSIDEVHKEMEVRFNKVLQGAGQFINDSLKKLFIKDQEKFNDKLYIYNSQPFSEQVEVETEIIVPKEDDTGSIVLYDNDTKIKLDILNREEREVFVTGIHAEPNWYPSIVYKVKFNIDIKGLGIKEVQIKKETFDTLYVADDNIGEIIENEYYTITLNSKGFLDVLDKSTDKIYRDVNRFVSSLDCGDEYTYCPPRRDKISTAELSGLPEIKKGNNFSTMKLSYTLNQPYSLNDARDSWNDNFVKSKIFTEVTLNNNSDLIEFKTKIENNANDHRLRVIFPIEEKVEFSQSDTAFDLVKRDVLRNPRKYAAKAKEVPVNTNPTYSTVFGGNLGVIHRGLQEYEVTEYNTKDAVYLTLMRNVGWLSRDDLSNRGGGAGPKMMTDDAQCIGTYEFEYGLVINKSHGEVLNKARKYRVKPISTQALGSKSKYDNLFTFDNKSIVMTALKRDKANNWVIRMWNSNDSNESLKIKWNDSVNSVFKGTLLDELEDKVEIINGESILEIKSKEICTLIVKIDRK